MGCQKRQIFETASHAHTWWTNMSPFNYVSSSILKLRSMGLNGLEGFVLGHHGPHSEQHDTLTRRRAQHSNWSLTIRTFPTIPGHGGQGFTRLWEARGGLPPPGPAGPDDGPEPGAPA